MTGYWGDPDRNRQVLVRRPAAGDLDEVYFRTGDRVRILDDGNLAFEVDAKALLGNRNIVAWAEKRV